MKKRNGFTLVELLVVVVILSILAAVVVGVVPSATARAKGAAFSATLSVVQAASDRFYAEFNTYPCASEPVDGSTASLVDMTATDERGDTFLGGYLQFEPNNNPADLGLLSRNGSTVYYGVTASGRVFATQEEPVEEQWTIGTGVVYTQDDVSGELCLGEIW